MLIEGLIDIEYNANAIKVDIYSLQVHDWKSDFTSFLCNGTFSTSKHLVKQDRQIKELLIHSIETVARNE